VNAIGVVLAVALASVPALRSLTNAAPPPVAAPERARIEPSTRADGSRVLVDRSGRSVVLRDFRRIASLASLADPLLLELCEQERVVAFSSHSREVGPDAHRYTHRPGADVTHIEALLELSPDLVLISSLTDRARVERLGEAGLTLFDLGMSTGLPSLLDTVSELGWLLGAPERAHSFATRFVARFDAVAADVPAARRRRALYVGAYGTQLFGGTVGTSYHDVLEHAGLLDAAEGHYMGWPSYGPEQLLTLNPALIVTQPGGRTQLCGNAALQSLAACATGGVVEVDEARLNDASVYMLDAAELVRAAVYGPVEAPRP
jgi:ABC-type Fe3+-hydroxamate transport system substrate-binding protein